MKLNMYYLRSPFNDECDIKTEQKISEADWCTTQDTVKSQFHFLSSLNQQSSVYRG
jgi:hypothetical protein